MVGLWKSVKWKIAITIFISYCCFLLLFVRMWLLQSTKEWGANASMKEPIGTLTPNVYKSYTNNFYLNKNSVKKAKEHLPWPQDPQCSKFFTRFGRKLPLKFLVSFPRSGNTWLRYLIEGATGLFTGTIYEDNNLYLLGFLGEIEPHNSRRTIVVKTHALPIPGSKYIQDITPTILVIRNPFESLVSFWSFNQKNDHFQGNDIQSFNTTDFRSYVIKQIDHWATVYYERLLWNENLLVIFYENLLKNPLKELRKVLNYLQFPVEEDRMKCLQKYIHGLTKRNKTEISPFTAEEKLKLKQALNLVLSLLKLRGIEDVPNEYYETTT